MGQLIGVLACTLTLLCSVHTTRRRGPVPSRDDDWAIDTSSCTDPSCPVCHGAGGR